MSLISKVLHFLTAVKEDLSEMVTIDGKVFQCDSANMLIDEFGNVVADGQYEMLDGSTIEVVKGIYSVVEKSPMVSDAPEVEVEVETETTDVPVMSAEEIKALQDEVVALKAKIATYESEAQKMTAKLSSMSSLMKPKVETKTTVTTVESPAERIMRMYNKNISK